MLSDAIQEKIILKTIEEAGIKTVDQDIQWPLITKSGINEYSKLIHYYYNYSSSPVDFVYPHKSGTELISGNKVENGAKIKINSWDVIIIEE
jgi:beta-galactosidase